jgi:hypothetical protein
VAIQTAKENITRRRNDATSEISLYSLRRRAAA